MPGESFVTPVVAETFTVAVNEVLVTATLRASPENPAVEPVLSFAKTTGTYGVASEPKTLMLSVAARIVLPPETPMTLFSIRTLSSE